MFQTVSLSIIRSLVLYTQQQVYVLQVLMFNVLICKSHTGYADFLLASSQHNLYNVYLLLCVQC